MKIGIISDIHANLEALEAVFEAFSDADAFFCLGDVVGYGPSPNECCDIIRGRNIPTLLGNHDAALAGKMGVEWFNPAARDSVEWTDKILTSENRDFLKNLPLTYRSCDFVAAHSSLDCPDEFSYIRTPWDSVSCMDGMPPNAVCFIGHTHRAEFFSQRIEERNVDTLEMQSGGLIELKPCFRYVINCGSIGQPRDGDPRACAAFFDTEAGLVDIRRVSYPMDITQGKMQAAGLPSSLWERLALGL